MAFITRLADPLPTPIPAPTRPAPSSRQTFNCIVSYEYERGPVQTFRCPVTASIYTTGLKMALQNAQAALRPHRWSSVVIVLERGARS
jgi:hypothetical protein